MNLEEIFLQKKELVSDLIKRQFDRIIFTADKIVKTKSYPNVIKKKRYGLITFIIHIRYRIFCINTTLIFVILLYQTKLNNADLFRIQFIIEKKN